MHRGDGSCSVLRVHEFLGSDTECRAAEGCCDLEEVEAESLDALHRERIAVDVHGEHTFDITRIFDKCCR
jgi:hypothetical protein